MGILSSKLLAWFFRLERNEFDDLFPKIRVEEFRNLPIPVTCGDSQTPIINLVNQILDLKTSGGETTALENRIDEMVYDLYELTEDEKEIVRNSV